MNWLPVTKVCKFFINKYLGAFFENSLEVDQLSVELQNGEVRLHKVPLNISALNELCSKFNLPLEFIDGYIEEIRVKIPWRNLLSANSYLEISGAEFTLKSQKRSDDASLFESIVNTMPTAKEVAAEMIASTEDGIPERELPEKKNIENELIGIFGRVIVNLENVVVRLESVVQTDTHFVAALQLEVGRVECKDKLATSDTATLLSEGHHRSTKEIELTDIRISVDKYYNHDEGARKLEGCNPMCPFHPKIASNPITVAYIKGTNGLEIDIIKSHDEDVSPTIKARMFLQGVPVMIDPQQIFMLTNFLNSLSGDSGAKSSNIYDDGVPVGPEAAPFIEAITERQRMQQLSRSILDGPPNGLRPWSEESYQDQFQSLESSTLSCNYLSVNHHLTEKHSFSFKIKDIFLVILTDSENSTEKSDAFFAALESRGLESFKTHSLESCLPFKHFRVLLDGISLNGAVKSSDSSHKVVEIDSKVSNVRVVYCDLKTADSILRNNAQVNTNRGGKQCLSIKFTCSNTKQSSSRHESSRDISCTLEDMTVKYDKRLQAAVMALISGCQNPRKETRNSRPSTSDDKFSIDCSNLSTQIRFQTLDQVDSDQLRPDYLSVTLEGLHVGGRIDLSGKHTIKVEFDAGCADYLETPQSELIQLARVFSNAESGSPSISIEICENNGVRLSSNHFTDHSMYTSALPSHCDDAKTDMLFKSTSDNPRKNGPLTSRNVMNSAGGQDKCILAGNRNEQDNFIMDCRNNSKVVVNIFLPVVVAEFASKRLLEIIYNRLLMDLTFTPEFQCHCFHEAEESECFYEPSIPSEPDFFLSEDIGDQISYEAIRSTKQSLLCLSLSLAKGCVAIGDGNPETGEYYSFQINSKDLQLHVVSAYQGDPTENFFTLSAVDVDLFHAAQASKPISPKSQLSLAIMNPEPQRRLLLSRIAKETFGDSRPNRQGEQLNLVVKIKLIREKRMKDVSLAIRIAESIWRHVMTEPKYFWIMQLIELFNLKDFPVIGHTPSAVKTELHFSVEKSLIDYRPINIPYNLLLNIDNVSLSSNIVQRASTSMFNLLLEDISFFMAKSDDQVNVPKILKDYVCLVHSGLLNVRLSVADPQSSRKGAKIRFSVSNDKIVVQLCADSLRALRVVIEYVAAEGDTPRVAEKEDVKKIEIVSPPQKIHVWSEEGDDDRKNLIEDAMKDALQEFSSDGFEQSSLVVQPSVEKAPAVHYKVGADDSFTILEPAVGSGRMEKNQEFIRLRGCEEIVIIEDFLSVKRQHKTESIVETYKLEDVSVVVYVYGGEDFSDEPRKPTTLNKIDLSSLGGSNRNKDEQIELKASKINFTHERLADDKIASRQNFSVKKIEITDFVKNSMTNIILKQWLSDSMPTSADMFSFNIVHYVADNECSIKVSVQPIWLNLDQNCLDFLQKFVANFLDMPQSDGAPQKDFRTVPVMGAEEELIYETSPEVLNSVKYIRSFEFIKDVPIAINYSGRHIAFDNGAQGVLMGLAQLNNLKIVLKRINHKNGLRGFDKLGEFVQSTWTDDIVKRQIPRVIEGVGPIHSVVQLVTGVKDLFYMPLDHYRRDGQFLRGVQLGTQSFGVNTTVAMLKLTERLVGTVQSTAEFFHILLSPTTNIKNGIAPAKEPMDFREGVNHAYQVMTTGIKDSATNIANAAAIEDETRGVTGKVGEVARQFAPAICRQFLGVTEATNSLLKGMMYQMVPEARQEEADKWKRSPPR